MAEQIQQKKIEGRKVALILTVITFILLILGLAGVGDFRKGWVEMGTVYASIFLGNLAFLWGKQTAVKVGTAFAKAKEMVATIQNGKE